MDRCSSRDVVVAETAVATAKLDSGIGKLGIHLNSVAIVEHYFISFAPAADVLPWGAHRRTSFWHIVCAR